MEYKGIIQIAHGMAEHIKRYEEFAEFMANKGFIVCGNDHSGHGNSISNEEDLGFFHTNEGYKCLVNDMKYLMTFMQKRFKNVPYILLGHSLGSFLARYFTFFNGFSLDGCIFTGSCGYSPLADVCIKLCDQGIKVRGAKIQAKSVAKLVQNTLNFKFLPVKTNSDWISSDPDAVKQFVDDERCGFPFTYSGYKDVFEVLRCANDDKLFVNFRKDLPIIFISGSKDALNEMGKGVKSCVDKHISCGCKNVKFKLFDGFRHEVLNEVNRQEVYNFIYDWIMDEVVLPKEMIVT